MTLRNKYFVTPDMIAAIIDHTFLLTQEEGVTLRDQEAAVRLLAKEAHHGKCYAVCVRDWMVKIAKSTLTDLGSPCKVAAVVGFPSGDACETKAIVDLIARTREQGADEFDMVAKWQAFNHGDTALYQEDIAVIHQAAGPQTLKVIFENACIPLDKRRLAYTLAKDAMGKEHPGVRFFKTSTGFARIEGKATGATIQDVRLMAEVAAGEFGIKPSGGIQDFKEACQFWQAAGEPFDAGAGSIPASRFRIGSSKLLASLKRAPSHGDNGPA